MWYDEHHSELDRAQKRWVWLNIPTDNKDSEPLHLVGAPRNNTTEANPTQTKKKPRKLEIRSNKPAVSSGNTMIIVEQQVRALESST